MNGSAALDLDLPELDRQATEGSAKLIAGPMCLLERNARSARVSEPATERSGDSTAVPSQCPVA
jgi:hypothetical protein